MFYLTSDFSSFSVSVSIPGSFTLSVVEMESGETIFSNQYFVPGVNGLHLSVEILGIDRIILNDLTLRSDYCRQYSISLSSDSEAVAPVISVPYGPPCGNSLEADFIADSGVLGSLPAAPELLKLSPLVVQSEFSLVNLPSSHPFAQYLSRLELTYYADGGVLGASGYTGNYLHSLSFFRSGYPVEDKSWMSQGWHSITFLPSPAVPFKLLSLDLSPAAAVDGVNAADGIPSKVAAVGLSTISVDSFEGLAMFQFRNRFNIIEPALVRGALSISPKEESQSVTIRRMARRVDIRRKDQFSFTVSGLSHKRAAELREMLYSGYVRLFLPGSRLLPAAASKPVEIQIESIEGEISQSSDSLPSLKISFTI